MARKPLYPLLGVFGFNGADVVGFGALCQSSPSRSSISECRSYGPIIW